MYPTKETSKSERITFRLTADNREALQADAADLGMSISELIEARLFEVAHTDHEAADNVNFINTSHRYNFLHLCDSPHFSQVFSIYIKINK